MSRQFRTFGYSTVLQSTRRSAGLYLRPCIWALPLLSSPSFWEFLWELWQLSGAANGIDTLCTLIANLGVTAPVFWVGIILILVFGYYLRWLPIQGWVSPTESLGKSLLHILMPAICLTVYPMASIARQTRSSMLEVIRQDYIRTAWAKGLNERQVIIKHAVRNAMIPVITLIGMNIRQIFGGAVLTRRFSASTAWENYLWMPCSALIMQSFKV